ncbi:MAG: hypoxanthine phosphoribosyltransferase [Myxococcales bacterium]|nr:hypoxanthine phosphoribosyltransferase [Myxococcales bacterium]
MMNCDPLITEAQIADRMPTLAAEIAAALPEGAGSPDGRLIVVGPLKGCLVFMADLSRALWKVGVGHDYDFMRLASYAGGTESSGEVRMESDLIHAVEGRPVLLVDDICDTGRTLTFARAHLLARGATSVTTSVLMDKPARRVVRMDVDHVGFTIPDAFVVGYGCDLAEAWRGLPYIGVLKPG